jgi:hypothetical protein
MDALPILLNQRQLQIMQDGAHYALSDLQQKQESGWFSSPDHKDDSLQTYGTEQYEEARALVQEIETQVDRELKDWQEADGSKAVGISLNSFQIGLLRSGLEQTEGALNGQGDAEEVRTLITDLMEQLPEESPQEDAD